MIVKAIILFIIIFMLFIILLWSNLNSAIEINRIFTSLDKIIAEDNLYKIMSKIMVYTDIK